MTVEINDEKMKARCVIETAAGHPFHVAMISCKEYPTKDWVEWNSVRLNKRQCRRVISWLSQLAGEPDRITELEQEVERLRGALEKYGRHCWPCTFSGYREIDITDARRKGYKCTCGLEQALKDQPQRD